MKAKPNLKIIEKDEIMKKIINLDTMSCIGYFSDKDKRYVFNKYSQIYAFCEFDIDGDLTISEEC